MHPDSSTRRKGRILLFIANVSLVIGLLLWNFREYILASNPLERDLLHAVCGFLLGLSITINLRMAMLSRHRRDDHSGSLCNANWPPN